MAPRFSADGDEGELHRPHLGLSRLAFFTRFGISAVVPRKPKLIAAAAVLAVGLGLAWPWRRGESVPVDVLPISPTNSPFGSAPAPAAVVVPAYQPAALSATAIGLGTSSAQHEQFAASAAPRDVTAAKLVQGLGQPLLPGVEHAEEASAAAHERRYIVQEGDSLERLALRYLGDEGRALELFDLNRAVLVNPHILPIGVELKLPVSAEPAARDVAL